MRAMGGRPVLMQRFPQGAGGPSFFQKRVPANAPDWLRDDDRADGQRHAVAGARGGRRRARRLGGQPRLPGLPRLAVPRRGSRARRRAAPGPRPAAGHGLRPGPRAAARELKALLDELGLAGFPKTTGNRGLHVYVRLQPRWDSYAVRAAAVAAARELERRRPDILTAAWWKEERGERIFVDYNQNAPHKTVFGAWSVRARAGGQVSTPLRWEELDDLDPDDLTLATRPDGSSATEIRGPRSTTRRSRWSRCWRCTSATARTACSTPRGRRSTRSSPTSPRGSRRAGPVGSSRRLTAPDRHGWRCGSSRRRRRGPSTSRPG